MSNRWFVAEASVQTAIAKYYSSSREIELAAVAPEPFSRRPQRQWLSPKLILSHSTALILIRKLLASEVEVFEDNDEIDLSSLTRMSEDAPVVRLVNVLLVDAPAAWRFPTFTSSPYEKELRIRFPAIDGLLYDVMHPPLKIARCPYPRASRYHVETGYL